MGFGDNEPPAVRAARLQPPHGHWAGLTTDWPAELTPAR